jgi:hypothetical protein
LTFSLVTPILLFFDYIVFDYTLSAGSAGAAPSTFTVDATRSAASRALPRIVVAHQDSALAARMKILRRHRAGQE